MSGPTILLPRRAYPTLRWKSPHAAAFTGESNKTGPTERPDGLSSLLEVHKRNDARLYP